VLDKSLIGRSLGERSITVEKGRLRFFANVIGESNPVYLDENAAWQAGHPSLPVPPTYLFCLEMEAFGSVGTAALTGMDAGRILHGEQQFEYHSPAYAGDDLTFSVSIEDVHEKKGGALDFLVKKTRVTRQDGLHIADLRSVVVQRNPPTARSPASASSPQQA